jgi:hypothetical protein
MPNPQAPVTGRLSSFLGILPKSLRTITFLVSLFVSLLSSLVSAAPHTWISTGDNKWSDGANWSEGSAPGPGNTVIFDGSSSADCNMDLTGGTTIAVLQLNSGYTGTLTLTAGSMTVTGALTLSAGTLNANTRELILRSSFTRTSGNFTAGTSTVQFNGSTGQLISNGTTFYNLVINNTAASPADNADVDPDGAIIVQNNLVISDGQFQPATGSTFTQVTMGAQGILKQDSGSTIWISGNFSMAGTFTANSGTVNFNGAGTQTLTSNSNSFNQLVHSGAGTLNTVNDVYISVLTNSAGTIQFAAGSYVNLSANSTNAAGATLDLNGMSELDLSNQALDILGILKLTGSEYFSNGDPGPATGSTVTYVATSGSYVLNSWAYSTLIINAAGSAYTLPIKTTVSRDFTLSGGTFTTGNATMTVAGITTISGGKYQTGIASQTFNGNFSITGGTFVGASGIVLMKSNFSLSNGQLIASSGTFNVSGDWTKTGGTFTPGTGTVTFNKASGVQQLNSGNANFYSVTYSGAGTLRPVDALTISNDFILTSGTFDNATNDVAVNVAGNVTMDNSRTDMGDAVWTIGGNWDAQDVTTFNENLSTITMTGLSKTFLSKTSGNVYSLIVDYGASTTLNNNTNLIANAIVRGTMTVAGGANFYTGSSAADIQVATSGVVGGAGFVFLGWGSSSISQMDGIFNTAQLSVGNDHNGGVLNSIAPGRYDSPTVSFYCDWIAQQTQQFRSGTYTFTGDVTFGEYAAPCVIDNSVNNPNFVFQKNVTVFENGHGLIWTKGSGTITFSSNTAAQQVIFRGKSVENIISSNTSSSGLTFTSSFTAQSFTVNSSVLGSAATIYFQGGGTFTISTFTITGSASNPVVLKSTASTPWILNNTSTNTVQGVQVSSSNASAGVSIVAKGGSVDLGSNTNWQFGSYIFWINNSTCFSPQNWNVSTNWSLSSGGSSCNCLPSRNDHVRFDGGGTAGALVNVDVTVASVTTTSAYTGIALCGQITFNSGIQLTTLNDVVLANRALQLVNGIWAIGGNLDWTGVSSFSLAASTVNFNGAGAQTITGATTFYNLLINNSAASPSDSVDVDPASAIYVQNLLTVNDGQFQPATGTQIATVTVNTNGILKPDSGAILTSSGNWTNSGTYTANGGTVTFTAKTGTTTITSGGAAFYDLMIDDAGGSATFKLQDNLSVSHNLTLINGVLDSNAGSNYTVNVTSDYIQATTALAAMHKSTMTVGGNFTGDGSEANGQYNAASLVMTGTATLNLNNNGWEGANGFYNLNAGINGSTVTLADGLSLWGGLTVGSGNVTGSQNIWFEDNGPTIPLSFNANSRLSVYALRFYPFTNRTIPTLNNGYDCHFIVAGFNALTQGGNVVINGTNGLYVHGDGVAGRNPSWTTNGYNLTIGGALVVGADANDTALMKLDASSGAGGNSVVTVGGDISVVGYSDTTPPRIIPGSSTFVLNGTGAQVIRLDGSNLNNLISSNTSSSGVTFSSSFTAAAMTVNASALGSAATVYFASNSTFTFSTFTMTGSGTNVVVLKSTNTAQWRLNNTSKNIVAGVQVSSSNAIGNVIYAQDSTGSNTTNWIFSPDGAYTTVQTGNWHDPNTWGGIVPSTSATVTIASGNVITATSTIKVASMTLAGTLTLQGNATFFWLTSNSGATLNEGANHLYFSSKTILASGTFVKNAGGWVHLVGDFELKQNNNNLGNTIVGSSPDTITLTSDATYDSILINSGDVFRTNGYDVTVTTDVTILSGGVFDTLDGYTSNEGDGSVINVGEDWYTHAGSTFSAVAGSTVAFNGSTAQVIVGTMTFANLVINNSYATPDDSNDVDPSSSVVVNYNLAVIDGQFQPAASTQLSTVTISVNGIFKQDSGASVTVLDNWTNSGTFTPNSGAILFNKSSGIQQVDAGASIFYNVSHTGGTLKLITNQLVAGGALINNTGTFDANGATVTVQGLLTVTSGSYEVRSGSHTLNGGLSVGGGGTAFNAGAGVLDINGNVAIAGAGTFQGGTGSVFVSGNFIRSMGASFGTGLDVIFDGSGVQALSADNNGSTIGTSTHSGTGILRLVNTGNPINMTKLFNTNGILDINGASLSVSGTFSNSAELVLIGSDTVSGVINNSGSTVTYRGIANASASTYTITDLTTTYYTLQINSADGLTDTFRLGKEIVVNGSMLISSGTFNVLNATNAITVKRDWTLGGANASFIASVGTVTFNGVLAESISGGTTFYNLYIDNTHASPSDTNDVDPTGPILVQNLLTLNDGQFQPATGSTFTAVFINTGGILKPDASATIYITGNMYGDGQFTHNNGTVVFSGSVDTTVEALFSFYNMILNKVGGFTLTANTTYVSGMSISNDLTLTEGVFDLNPNSCDLGLDGDLYIALGAGLLKSNTIMTFGGTTAATVRDLNISDPNDLGTVSIEKTSGVPANDKVTFLGDSQVQNLTVQSGNTLDLSSSTLYLAGTSSILIDLVAGSSFTATSGTSTISFLTGPGNYYLPAQKYYNVSFVGAGSYRMTGNTTFYGSVNIPSGTFDAVSSTNGLSVKGNWTETGAGRFVPSGGTVRFDGTAAQSVRGFSFNNVISSNVSSGGLTFTSSSTMASLWFKPAMLTGAATVYFAGGSTYTISTFTVVGSDTKPAILKSTSTTAWLLKNTSQNFVSGVQVSSSNASSGLTIVAVSSSVNVINNTNWQFGGDIYWPGGADIRC